MNKTVINIKGMHCKSCEMVIEDELMQVPGVTKAQVSHANGNATIHYNNPISMAALEEAIQDAGYSIGVENIPFFSKDTDTYRKVGIITLFLFNIWVVTKLTGFSLPSLETSGDYSSLPVVFLIGITAGLSTCMALVGGLVLGISSRFAEKHPTATGSQKFKPHLFFNIGRIASFLAFGALLGIFGSLFRFSSGTLGLLVIAVSIVMFFFGLQLTELFPKLSILKLMLPKSISRFLGIKEKHAKEYSHKNSALLGALTFFLPCGFTQAMQLYAISTGNPVASSLTMGVFALGTTPGLLGIGGFTSLVKGAFAQWFFKFAGVVVVVLALYNFQNGLNLSGFQIKRAVEPSQVLSVTRDEREKDGVEEPASAEPTSIAEPTPEKGKNNKEETASPVILKSVYTPRTDMVPNGFTVKKGVPVRLEIEAKENGTGCMGSITVPGLSDTVDVFRKGKTSVFTFTPQEKGEFYITCAMGIPRGTITVI